MRRITIWVVSTLSALVLLFSYRTSTSGPTASAVAAGSGSSGTSQPAPTAQTGGTTYTGDSVDTRWGPVTVQITVTDGKITDVAAVEYPQDNPRDVEINAAALPALHDEVIDAQSADVDTISGATVTSDGYISSLQSALDDAHLGS